MTEILEERYSVEKISKVFDDNKITVPVVFATDKNFVPYLYVAIQSLVDNTSKDNNYDIVILYTDVEQYKLDSFKDFIAENISVRFYDMSALMAQYKERWYVHWNWSNAIYYRFFIPKLFANYNKVLYLDGDIIINTDLAELYNIELDDCLLGAIQDISQQMTGYSGEDYRENVLHIERKKYFNSGILSMNIAELIKFDFCSKCLQVLKELETPVFPDQDVINLVCCDKIKYIDYNYNLMWNCLHYFKDAKERMDYDTYDKYIKSWELPKIFHFCGAYRPWKQPNLRYSSYFWKYARKTPYYEEILYSNTTSKDVVRSQIRNVLYRKKIYFNYLKCKILKMLTSGKRREHYIEKSKKLKAQVNDYRATLNV